MATLATAGRITDHIVADEIARLQRLWHRHLHPQIESDEVNLEELLGQEKIDLFDTVQLRAAIRVCRQSKSMSDAGRKLFAVSRDSKAKPNDADRLKKYLAKFGLT